MSLLSLPDEIVEEILTKHKYRAKEITAVSSTCRRFREIIQRSARIWRRLFTVHFPEIAHQLEDKVDSAPHEFWKSQFIARYTLGAKVDNLMKQMSPKHFQRHALSNIHMEHFIEDQESNVDSNGLLITDAIQTLVNKGDQDRDLTSKYYARQVSQFIRQHFLAKQWINFMQKEPQNQDYYQGLVLISQWFQPLESISIDRVKSDVVQIALETLEKLKERNSKHPVFDLDDKEKLVKDEEVLTEDRFGGGKNSIEILDALNETFFQDMGFRGNTANYYNPANSFIDKVLENKQGIPITLCLLYSLVTKMLGVVTLPINFPRHFLLRWENTDFLYIDVFQNGARKTAREIQATTDTNPENFDIAKPGEVFQRMVRNLVTSAQVQEHEYAGSHIISSSLLRTSLELTKFIGGNFEYPGFALCQIYLQLSINQREVIKELDNYENWPANMWVVGDHVQLKNQIRGLRRICLSQLDEEQAETEETTVKKRSNFSELHQHEDLNRMSCYSVGMVMKHRKYNYYCVIYGWDPICKATKMWVKQMGVDKLPNRENQPFYNVLVEDGSNRYAADENLEIAKPVRVSHPAIGRYFKHFHTDIGYEPNEELAKSYPEDKDVREHFYLYPSKPPNLNVEENE